MGKKSSSILINESPLIVLPTLACVLGLNNAIVLQQIQYWLAIEGNGVESGGYKWVYNTYGSWNKQFPFWSEDTIYRSIRQLEAKGVLISEKLWQYKSNQTKFYRIDFDTLGHVMDAYLQLASPQIAELKDNRILRSSITANCGVLYTETTTEITTETTGDSKTESQNQLQEQPMEIEDMAKGPTSSALVLDHIKTVQKPIVIEDDIIPTSKKLQSLYRKTNPNFVANYTKEQKGMFNHIVERMPDSLNTMQYVLNNWISFTKYVEESVGIKNTPLKPAIYFILKYCAEAYNYYQESTSVQLIAKPQVKPKPVPTTSDITIIDDTVHIPATLEEILAVALEE